jgi:hypothetical protein
MTNPVRRFETTVLRPFWVLTLAASVFAAFHSAWGSVAVGVILLWYLGIVGSSLHPLQTGLDLAKGLWTIRLHRRKRRSFPSGSRQVWSLALPANSPR